MPLVTSWSLATLYRLLHLLGMAVLLGGAVFVAVPGGGSGQRGATSLRLDAAQRYEWLFWAAMLAQVITGIGNLGVRGYGVPGPEQPWGALLYLKLWLVLALLLISVVRSIAVARLLGEAALSTETSGASSAPRLRRAYGTTAALLTLIVLAALRMAHG